LLLCLPFAKYKNWIRKFIVTIVRCLSFTFFLLLLVASFSYSDLIILGLNLVSALLDRLLLACFAYFAREQRNCSSKVAALAVPQTAAKT